MRPRGFALVVLALLFLGGVMHVPLHAAEQHADDCPLNLFCEDLGSVVALPPPPALPIPRHVGQSLRASDRLASHCSRSIRSIRGPPRS